MQALHTPTQAAQWLRQAVTGELHIDSRKVKQGDGFLAWPGLAHDARDYVAQALAQGASACLVEATGAHAFTWAQDEQKIGTYIDLKQACGPIADAYYESPSQQLQVLAVTGTNGKTSTAWWLSHALTSLGKRCAVVGTLGMGQGDQMQATGMTTPDPVRLHSQLRQWADDGVKACAIEASSIGLSEYRLEGTQISVAIFTNFTQDHLDYHAHMDDYWKAKAKLFAWPKLKAAVINIDDPQGKVLVQQLQTQNSEAATDVWTVSMHQPARLRAKDVHNSGHGLQFQVQEGEEVHSLHTDWVADFNVINVLGVIAAMRSLGVSLADAVQACRGLPAVPGRMQSMGGVNAPCVVVDYAHTPDALLQALKALLPMAKAREGDLHCVFGCGGNRDTSKRAPMAKVAEEFAHHLVFTSDNPRNEDPEQIIQSMVAGLSNTAKLTVCIDRAQAIAQTIAQAKPQDVILVAGKGHENYQEIGASRLSFSDTAHAMAALKLRGWV